MFSFFDIAYDIIWDFMMFQVHVPGDSCTYLSLVTFQRLLCLEILTIRVKIISPYH